MGYNYNDIKNELIEKGWQMTNLLAWVLSQQMERKIWGRLFWV